MELVGKLIQMLPLQTGTGRNGEWKKQDVIVETSGNYPKKVCISIWGDKINTQVLQTGNVLKISYELESREFNGRWYTDVRAWRIDLNEAVPTQKASSESQQDNFYEQSSYSADSDTTSDDLPF